MAEPASKPYDNAHHLLIHALTVTASELHPARPFHGGGPQPKIDAAGYVAAALWLADRADPFVDPRDRESFDGWVELARRHVAFGSDDTSLRPTLYQAIAATATRIPLKIGVWAAHEAANCAFRPIYAGGAARPSARQFAKLLVKRGSGDSVRAYLHDLDSLCVHLEADTMVRGHSLSPSARPDRSVWRGITNDRASHWLLKLVDGNFALIGKIGSRWTLTEGARDYVLAHIPDAQLDAAVAAAMAA